MKMRIRTMSIAAFIYLASAALVLGQEPAPKGPGMAMKNFNVDDFVKQVDTDKDGSMSKEEWKAAGLIDLPFSFCDTSKDGEISEKEMAGCSLPEMMDSDGNGVLTVSEMIEFDKRMASAPKKKYEATSPYVEGGATGMDFIKLFDADNDGKVTHEEWEKTRPSTVFKDKHWPEYNKNMDEYITVDEAPQKPKP
jgi:Ca2+-binding EF-hand superfamily protein